MYPGHNCTNYAAYRLIQNGANADYLKGHGNAYEWGSQASAHGVAVNGTPAVGAIAWWDANSNGVSGSGHVAYVEEVGDGYIVVSEDNYGGDFRWVKLTPGSRYPTAFLHFKDVAPSTQVNDGVALTAANWSGDGRQDLAYVTPRASGGFDVAVQETTANGLVWRGVWWSEDTQKLATIKFIPGDQDGDGLTDLWYATPRAGGFDLALMHNTGNGFVWQGQQWNPALPLATTKFIPGQWAGDGRTDIAYLTRRTSGGFDFAVLETGSAGLTWRGVWWTTDSLTLDSMKPVPADTDNDGLTDLFYATPNGTGFDLALMHNTGSGLSWQGQHWNPTGLNLARTRFIPGNWGGTSAGDFAYVTPRGDGGFDLAVFISTPAGIQWQERLHEPGLAFDTARFMPADVDLDGYTDLYYATPRGGGGLDLALHRNTGTAYTWAGPRWNPSSPNLADTTFLPQNSR
jgi:hypothetical protein